MRIFFAALAFACLVLIPTPAASRGDLSKEFIGDRWAGNAPAAAPQRAVQRQGRKAYRKAKRVVAKATKVVAGTIAGFAQAIMPGTNNERAEASLTPALRDVVADLRQKHGAGCVIVEGGRSDRAMRGGKRRSCHWGGEAFDGRLCASARADVRSRPELGSITYSGAMSHDHVSLCNFERGVRTHLVVNGKGIPIRLAKKHKRARYANAQ